MAVDRAHAQRYLDNTMMPFVIERDGNTEGEPLIITTTVTDAARLGTLLPPGVELRPANEDIFFGWIVDEVVESVEGSDFEAEFNKLNC
jgi:hypothetical protein